MLTGEAYSRALLADEDPLSNVSLDDAERDYAVNALSALAAAKAAVAGFARLPPGTLPTFIYTGNKLNVLPTPNVLTFGMGKTSVWHMIATLVKGYKAKGYRSEPATRLLESLAHALGADSTTQTRDLGTENMLDWPLMARHAGSCT